MTDVEVADQIGNQYTGAAANGKFIVVDIQLTNEKDEPATIFADNIRILGGNGSSYSTSDDAMFVYPDQNILLNEIQPGVTESGKLVYDIPPGAVKRAKLRVEDLFSGSTGEIELGL